MKTKILLFIILLLIGVIYINSRNDSATQDLVNTSTIIHIIDGLDPSGTTKGNGWPWPTKSFFEQQISFLEQNGGGVLEIYNFSLSIPNPVKVSIEPLKITPDVYEGEEVVKKVVKYNESIIRKNDLSKSLFWDRLQNEILNFEPKQENDYSYVNSNCRAILQSVSLPQYARHVTYTFLYSDFQDHTPFTKPKSIEENLLPIIATFGNLAICNYSNSKLEESSITMPTYNDFIGFLNSNSLTIKK